MTGDIFALRVHIGPVQGFIAAGRRTRDFWAGSFLLSLLSGAAMDAIIAERAGAITIPAVHGEDGAVIEKTLKAIGEARGREAGEPVPGPMAGTLVNHFRAEVSESFDPNAIRRAVKARFKSIADEVFMHFIAPALEAYQTAAVAGDKMTPEKRERKIEEIRARWDLQTDGSFFEVLWVKGPIIPEQWIEESRWLDRRKTTRLHVPIDEVAGGLPGTGDRCPVHPDLCELGGFSRVYEHDQQEDFWAIMRRTIGSVMYPGAKDWSGAGEEYRDTLELRQGERLSGMALVKRLFPLLPEASLMRCIGWVPDFTFDIDAPAREWSAVEALSTLRNWASTAFVAAIPWIVVAGKASPEESENYANRQYKELGLNPIIKAERPQRHRIEGIDALATASTGASHKKQLPLFAVLDGTLHFRRGLEKRRFAKSVDGRKPSGNALSEAERLAGVLAGNFGSFVDNVRSLPAPSLPVTSIGSNPAKPFYAMLEMDGDGMGEVFSKQRDRAIEGSKALLVFSEGVAKIVRSYDGVLIYAGADDVNAMLPVDTAIACAAAIRGHWQAVMATELSGEDKPTLSGSIVFSDYQNALDDVRRLSHSRLDNVAKDGMGRDALAIAVLKSGGVTAEWASCWDSCDGQISMPETLFGYAQKASDKKSVASRLPYLIRDRFLPLLECPGNSGPFITSHELQKLVAKELSDSGIIGKGITPEDRKKELEFLAAQVVLLLEPIGQSRKKMALAAPRHVGGMLVARFLVENVLWPYLEERKQRSSGTKPAGDA